MTDDGVEHRTSNYYLVTGFVTINEKRSAWTCWGSGVKFSYGSTFGRWRSYDRTNSLRTPTMKESQLLREKTTFSVFVSTCSNAVHAQFH